MDIDRRFQKQWEERHKLKGRNTSYSNERMGENTRKTKERGGKRRGREQ